MLMLRLRVHRVVNAHRVLLLVTRICGVLVLHVDGAIEKFEPCDEVFRVMRILAL